MRRQWTQGPDFLRILSARPDQAAQIRRLLLCDPSFRDLCDDYLTVLDMIADFNADASHGPIDAPEEYIRLGTELDLDITRALQRSAQKPGS